MVSKCFSREIEEVWKYAGRTETPIRDDRQRSVLVGQGEGGDERGLRSGGVEERGWRVTPAVIICNYKMRAPVNRFSLITQLHVSFILASS